MMRSTNLALRPFRNERLPWFLAALLIVGATFLSLAHARFINRLLSGDEAKTVRLVREDEARIATLEENIARQPPLKVDPAELLRLKAFKELVDRRVFPWRRLLTELETTLSEDVRFTSIAPVVQRDSKVTLIELEGRARTKDAAFSLAESLEAAPAFSNVVLRSLSEEGNETEFSMEVQFDSRPPVEPAPSAAVKPAAGGRS